jgi:hypothetical protein
MNPDFVRGLIDALTPFAEPPDLGLGIAPRAVVNEQVAF